MRWLIIFLLAVAVLWYIRGLERPPPIKAEDSIIGEPIKALQAAQDFEKTYLESDAICPYQNITAFAQTRHQRRPGRVRLQNVLKGAVFDRLLPTFIASPCNLSSGTTFQAINQMNNTA